MKRRILFTLMLAAGIASAGELSLYDGKHLASVVHEDGATFKLAANMLAHDLESLSGRAPKVSANLADCRATCVVIGRYDSQLVARLAQDAGIDLAILKGQWERYSRVAIVSKRDPNQRYLLIAGSDPRGAVYGVVDLTREMGVSAWEWWADVAPARAAKVAVGDTRRDSAPPSVQYRGVFLNDEDWGLQPWAAKTFDPATGDIGPKTYARIYELLWRLKANTIWPAMHDVTKPFYQIAGNPEMARDYSIVVGTSHAEPMMRNNVREWDKKDGAFNFFTNRDKMIGYWQKRVDEVKGFENIYSVGLRGIHDSAMEGAKNVDEARDGVADVIGVERAMLSKAQGRPPQQIPQALTLYKEVLDIYKAGLKVPEDITLVWPDDNYGYLAQLSNADEAKRAGGTGLYYHLSYWGRPHDYLWLGTTHPALIREQMDRAWQTGSRKLWIVNVGDIKPLEYLTQYFLDLAFDHNNFAQTPRQHLQSWLATQFGAAKAGEIADLMMAYYDLAWERRPEFMGFGQTEPTTPNKPTAYLQSGGDEAERRLARYAALAQQADAIGAALPAARRDAFFELVQYPVRSSANINARILKLELAARGPNSEQLVQQARAAHAALVADAATYNALAGGKWRRMMDIAPRKLSVFKEPDYTPTPNVVFGAPGQRERLVSIAAVSAKPHPLWETVPGLGSQGASLRVKLDTPSLDPATPGAPLVYEFNTVVASPAQLKFVALPTHPLTSRNQLRLAFSVDGGPLEVRDFSTKGRSEEWKQNVLSNTAKRSIALAQLAAGRHTLQVYALDPGFILDRIEVASEGAPTYYGAAP
ncbi:MAG: glycosyl hydrolase 115 family protein [Massilia sp.]